jgi:hypothetical protein
MKHYIHITTVTITAPKGYRPRKIECRQASLSRSRAYKAKAEANFLSLVKEKSASAYEDMWDLISFKAETVTTEVISVDIDNRLVNNEDEQS